MSAADNVHVFVWNVDWESEVKDWPYQFANADYKVVMTPGKKLLSLRYLSFSSDTSVFGSSKRTSLFGNGILLGKSIY